MHAHGNRMAGLDAVTRSMVLGPRGAQTLRTVWFWDPKAPKPYAQYGLGTQRRPNLTHNMFWDPEAPKPYAQFGFETEKHKPYAQYVFGTQKRPNLTHSMVWGPKRAQTLRTVWFRDQGGPWKETPYPRE